MDRNATMTETSKIKELMSQFVLPLALCASILGLVVFWPFTL